MKEGIKEYYTEEIKETYNVIDMAIKNFSYLEDYEDLTEEIIDELEKACDKLYESQNYLLNALNMIKRS